MFDKKQIIPHSPHTEISPPPDPRKAKGLEKTYPGYTVWIYDAPLNVALKDQANGLSFTPKSRYELDSLIDLALAKGYTTVIEPIKGGE